MMRNIFADDDRGVSPVIGVILMVAITVILAAVIATFVIGLGENNQTTAPNTSFDVEYDTTSSGDGELTVTMGNGESLNAKDVHIRGDLADGNSIDKAWSDGDLGDTSSDLSSGNSITILGSDSDSGGDLTQEFDIRVIWEDPDSDQSFELTEESGSEA